MVFCPALQEARHHGGGGFVLIGVIQHQGGQDELPQALAQMGKGLARQALPSATQLTPPDQQQHTFTRARRQKPHHGVQALRGQCRRQTAPHAALLRVAQQGQAQPLAVGLQGLRNELGQLEACAVTQGLFQPFARSGHAGHVVCWAGRRGFNGRCRMFDEGLFNMLDKLSDNLRGVWRGRGHRG